MVVKQGVPRTFIRCTHSEMHHSGIRDHAWFAQKHQNTCDTTLARGLTGSARLFGEYRG